MRLLSHTVVIMIATLFASCGHDEPFPYELVNADSAYMSGNHQRGDHLLEAYKSDRKESETDATNYYFQLMELERAYMHSHVDSHYYERVDSLCHYYKDTDDEKFAKALLFMGDLYFAIADYPAAVNCLLNANSTAERINDKRLLCLISRSLGDVYLEQRSLQECVPFFQRYFTMAVECNDTLRMAYAAQYMALVNTIENDIDSIEYYYKLAYNLGSHLQNGTDIMQNAMCNLCDFYIQTEQFDKALEVMPRNELNDVNWAYWHYGQGHVDSAIVYFEKSLGRYKWQGEVEMLQLLAEMEEQRGNLKTAVRRYEQLSDAKDSLREQQKQEATRRMAAQYDYTRIKQQRDMLKQNNNWLHHMLIAVVLGMLVFVMAVVFAYKAHHQRKKALQTQLLLMEGEIERQRQISKDQQRKNEEALAKLRRTQAVATPQDDYNTPARLQMKIDELDTQNENIAARERRKDALLQELHATTIYKRLREHRQLTEEEWGELAVWLDDIYDNFCGRITTLAHLKETELRTCMLLKLCLSPTEIADILCKSKQAITMTRKRMYQKFCGKSGSAEELDELIAQL